MISGSVNNYLKQKSLWLKAQQNMREPAKSSDNSSLSSISERFKEMAEQNKLSSIMNKMKAGKRLSGAEKEYLKNKSPDAYRRYQMIEAERDNYGKQLDGAKSKKEAAALHQAKIAQLYSESRSGTAAADSELYVCRAAALSDEYRQYVEKGKKRHRDEQQTSIMDKAGAAGEGLWQQQPAKANKLDEKA